MNTSNTHPLFVAYPPSGQQEISVGPVPVVQFFDSTTDSIRFHWLPAAGLNFRPQFVEHFAPFRFVYLKPQKV